MFGFSGISVLHGLCLGFVFVYVLGGLVCFGCVFCVGLLGCGIRLLLVGLYYCVGFGIVLVFVSFVCFRLCFLRVLWFGLRSCLGFRGFVCDLVLITLDFAWVYFVVVDC